MTLIGLVYLKLGVKRGMKGCIQMVYDYASLMGVCQSGLPPWEAPVMIAEKRKLFFSFWSASCLHAVVGLQSSSTDIIYAN